MLVIQVEGSTGDSYTATFAREGDILRALCSCPAGASGTHCKHRLALLAGDFRQARGDLTADVGEQVATLLRGTEVERVLQALSEAQRDLERAQREVKSHKKALDRVMHQ